MNELNARAVSAGYGVWKGQFRLFKDGDWSDVCERGEPVLYGDKGSAELAAWRIAGQKANASVVGFASKFEDAKAAANRIFQKGREIPVVRKGK
jgi:hypothetical protein